MPPMTSYIFKKDSAGCQIMMKALVLFKL